MRLAAAPLAALVLGGCAAAPQEAQRSASARLPVPPPVAPAAAAPPVASAIALRNPGFEAEPPAGRACPAGWDCTVHNSPHAFRFFVQGNAAAGARSLCVERVADEPWALVTQAFENPALRGKRLRLSMSVTVEGATGGGAGPWALVQGNPPVHQQRLVRGTAGWQRVAVEIGVPANGLVVEVGATMEGPGKACFDDVQLEIAP